MSFTDVSVADLIALASVVVACIVFYWQRKSTNTTAIKTAAATAAATLKEAEGVRALAIDEIRIRLTKIETQVEMLWTWEKERHP